MLAQALALAVALGSLPLARLWPCPALALPSLFSFTWLYPYIHLETLRGFLSIEHFQTFHDQVVTKLLEQHR